MACVLGKESPGTDLNPPFEIELVSIDGKSIKYSKNLEIKPDRPISEVTHTDMIMVPSSGYDINTIASYPKETLDWIKLHNQNGTKIAGICTGVFLLAEAGILNGKKATTHWALADWFQKKYPEIHLTPERMVTEDGNTCCSGGGSAGIDLCLHLIEGYCGQTITNRCAKILLLERGRDFQTPFTIFNYQKNHKDSEIIKAQ
ncbi:MAG: DJ-1/PfpI family protein [Desulfobacterium sp.]|nr:DJ-1/PfpI family protein [Desulfobacterium sp.]